MTPLSDAELRRIDDLHRESLRDYWRQFYRERGMAFTEADIEELVAMDAEAWPEIAKREREENR